jgi:ABC-type metal ion transport system substrate-binding protein
LDELQTGGSVNANLFQNQTYLQQQFATANDDDAKAAAATARSEDAG